VGGNPPQTQKPRSQGAWALNPADVHGAKRCLGPAWARVGPTGPGQGLAVAMALALVMVVALALVRVVAVAMVP
jgi:hypothetical protein